MPSTLLRPPVRPSPTESDPDSRWTRVRRVLRRHRVFYAATAVVALHVADDNFLQPNPGVSARDHLVSGLVPILALLAAAAAYPRVRAGSRALIALSVGLTGLVVGAIEAGYYTFSVGPSGDDWTGLGRGRRRRRAAGAGRPPAVAVAPQRPRPGYAATAGAWRRVSWRPSCWASW